MLEILKITEIVIAILLIFVILIQNKNVSLNLASMSGGMAAVTKRGPEKILHITTIVLWVAFIVNSLAFFILY